MRFFLAICSLLFTTAIHSQPVLELESVTYPLPHNIGEQLEGDERPGKAFEGRAHALLTFDELPSSDARDRIKEEGVRFLSYIPEKSYLIGYDKESELDLLLRYQARSLTRIRKEVRMATELLEAPFPDHAVKGGLIELQTSFFSDIQFEKGMKALRKALSRHGGEGAKVLRTLPNSSRVEIRVLKEERSRFATLPFAAYTEPIDPKPTPDDRTGRSLHRSNVINGQLSGGLSYDGDSIVMAIADDGGIGPHIDFKGRVTDHTGGLGGGHGDMTAGIAVGAGNIDPSIQGHASGARLHMYDISGYPHINNAVTNLSNLGTRITSTSYSQGCNDYDMDAANADQQIHQNPELIHVFSAGNSASSDCGYGAQGWGNITGGTKQGKNVIASGNLDDEDTLANSSSRGPAQDGRIKPDLCANGAGQLSTEQGNVYDPGGGTSAAAPSIAGVIAQLYDAYKDLNGGQYPSSALIKASLLNTAEDLDDHGPDFNTGWGRIDAARAYRLIEDGRYKADTIDQGGTNTHNISVPSNVEELRVMIYWADPAGSPSASRSLVNDLNVELTTPGGTNYDPWVLDHTPNSASLDAPATRGRDSINNVEQVTIQTPGSGSYSLNVEGYSVPQGPQPYYLVYTFMQGEVELSYPRGGEGFVPNTKEKLRWDAFGNSGSFDLAYSTDSGISWSNIATGVSGDKRTYEWTVPDTMSGKTFVRVIRSGSVDSSEGPFAIIDTASQLHFEKICPDSAILSWDSAKGAIAYDIYALGNRYMDSVGHVTDTSFTLDPFNVGKDQWFSVSPVAPNGKEGRRARAIPYKSGTVSNCPLDSNLKLSMLTPSDGLVPDCHSNKMPVKVKVKNVGLDTVLNFSFHYSFDGGTAFDQSYNDTLAPDSSVVLSFSDSITLTNNLPHNVQSWVEHPSDMNSYNDSSSTATLEQFNAQAESLHYVEDLEALSVCQGQSSDCQHECTLQGLTNSPHPEMDDIDWRVGKGETPSPNTGPSQDAEPGTAQGNYLYVEASYGCEEQKASLLTPCIDISNGGARLAYSYHMYGSEMGTLHVDVLVDGEWHKNVVSPVSGGQGNAWIRDSVDLTGFQGERLTVRFRGITGDGFHSDLSLDNIRLINVEKPPDAGFVTTPQNTCLGEVVTLEDTSKGAIDSIEWQVTPGSPAYVNGTGPKDKQAELLFNSSGSYQVRLVASNAYGSDTVIKTDHIQVGATGQVPFSEDFDGASYPPEGWRVINGGGATTWDRSSSIAQPDGGGGRSAFVQNFGYNDGGIQDELQSEVVDISALNDPHLSFELSYAREDASNYESLQVAVSGDCGANDSIVYFEYGEDLATAPDTSAYWIPESYRDWRKVLIDLGPFKGSKEMVLSFINVNGDGNNLYIDNINIRENPTSISDNDGAIGPHSVYPNPAKERLMIEGELASGGTLGLRIDDFRGRTVKELSKNMGKGRYLTNLDVRSLEPGVYFLKIRTPGGKREVAKFMVQR